MATRSTRQYRRLWWILSGLTPVKEMVRLIDFELARERFHVLSVGYHLNDPPILIAEDLEIHRIWVAEKVLPGSLGPLGGNAAGLIERH